MNDYEKSDDVIVPEKLSNKAAMVAAEKVEGRTSAKENVVEQNAPRTQGRAGAPSALHRVREKASRDRKLRFTALLHHVYDVDCLRVAYQSVKRTAAPGIDGETWHSYGEDLEANLRDLSARLKSGAYRAKPVRRAYIAKSDGRQRPLGVPVLEDKIVQRALTEVLNTIFDTDFLGFSYGFRPGRSPHSALDALTAGITVKKVSWVLDADIRDFFGTLDHGWLVKFLEHRIGDRRVIRLIRKWLTAGVLEDGRRTQNEKGTVQGGSISPLLGNLFLHYVFDLWVHQWRKRNSTGDVIVVRYADDFVVGFQHRHEAERFMQDLRERFARFGLALHEVKTRLLEFGRFAEQNRRRRGAGKPDTFEFLGFAHICGKTTKGRFVVIRRTSRKRMIRKLKEVKEELRRRFRQKTPELGRYLRRVLLGHMNYYAVPMNFRAIKAFRHRLRRLWKQSLERRSQVTHVCEQRMDLLVQRWLSQCRICHPYPLDRLRANQGRSRMR